MTKTRTRIAILATIVTVLVVTALTSLMRTAVSASFEEFETVATEMGVERAHLALDRHIDTLEVLVGDWAPWDDTYAFVREPYDGYIEGNLSASTLDNLRINGMLFFDNERRLVHAAGFDSRSRTTTRVPSDVIAAMRRADELYDFENPNDAVGGIVATEDDFLLAAAAPINDSTRSKPTAGTLVAFVYVDDRLDQELSAYVRSDVKTGERAHSAGKAPGLVKVNDENPAARVMTISEQQMLGAIDLRTLGNQRPLRVAVLSRRTFYESGRQMTNYLSSIVAMFGLAVGLFTAISADRRILTASRQEMERLIRERTEELEASESRFRDLVENMADGLIAFEGAGLIVHANREACRILAPDGSDLVGRALEEVLVGEVIEEQTTEYGWCMEMNVPRADSTLAAIEVVSAGSDSGLGQVLVRDVSARKRYEEQLLHLATHDHLTGLASRRRFEEELQREIEIGLRTGATGAVLWLDLDNFKDVNDSLGHRAGDDLLVELASFLQENTRSYSTVSRFGGDEFALLLPQTSLEEAESTGRRLLKALDSHRFTMDGHALRISACVGSSTFPADGQDAQAVLTHADLAMYAAKEKGCGTFVSYADLESPAGIKMPTRLEWLERIKTAVESGSFIVHAQPIVDCHTDEPSSYELLIRLPEPGSDKLCMPSDFMPAAERLGLVRDIDRWMIDRAAQLLAENEGLELDVNISALAFSDLGLLDLIKDKVAQYGIDARRLGFEITETAAIADTAAARELAIGLRDMGCRLSLDDFGAGFSSLHYLRHLPVNRLKIDGDFVRNLVSSEQDRHLVRAMVEIARALGVSTVAECVENVETLKLVRYLGVDYAQGYAVGSPAPFEEILDPA